MKVLFLDVDGVLNSRESDARNAISGGDLMAPDPKLVIRLLGILQETGAKVVLTTSWRLDKSITWPFPVYDVTPRLDAFGLRSKEIEVWLAPLFTRPTNDPVDSFVIVDDEPDAGVGFEDHFILVNPQTGLSPADAAKIVGLFT